MNALPRNDMSADAFLANDTQSKDHLERIHCCPAPPARECNSPRFASSPNNSPTTVAFSVAPCRMPKIVLRPSWLIPKAATICWPANGVASISNAQLQLVHPPFHHFFQLRPAGFDEVFADGALLQAICLAELSHRLTVFPRA